MLEKWGGHLWSVENLFKGKGVGYKKVVGHLSLRTVVGEIFSGK